MSIRYFDRDGAEITPDEWTTIRADRQMRRVGSDYVTIDGTRVLVSTQWFGIVVSPRSEGQDTPFLYDTALYTNGDNAHDGWNRRYDTLAAAAAGHAEIVDGLRAGRWPA